MGETDYHISTILYLRQALRLFFRQVEDLYVAADMLFYYEEGVPESYRVPDVFVVKGVAKHDRRIYKLWEEGVAPCVVFEITSRGTWLEDLGTKRGLYERIGVREYFLFDPLEEYLEPRLQGFRLVAGRYQPIPLRADGTLISEELGLILKPAGAELRLVDPASGQPLPTLDEAVDLMGEALQRVEVEARRAEAEAQRAEAEAQRAEAEAQRAEAEARRAEAEAQRADTAEAKVARLLEELERLRKQNNSGQM